MRRPLHSDTLWIRFQRSLVHLWRRLRWARTRHVVLRSRIFDPRWYAAAYHDVGKSRWDPVVHYLAVGASRGLKPHLLFDPVWYAQKRATAVQNPLLDYIRTGARLGVDPSPYFNSRHYLAAIGRPLRKGLSPLGDFVAYGMADGIVPTPFFDRQWYLQSYPDVLRSGFDAFLHYVASGDRDGRSPGPWFDASWYRIKNMQARDSGWSPLQHYLAMGAADARDPCGAFATQWYLSHIGEKIRDTSEALLHYVSNGRKSWHSTHPFLPPPGSPVAFWEDLPWVGRRAGPSLASRRVLVIASDGEWARDANRRIIRSLALERDLEIFVLNRIALDDLPESVALLELREPLPVSRAMVVSRVLRALKFRGAGALVIQIGPDPDTSLIADELELERVVVTQFAAQESPPAIPVVPGRMPASSRLKVSAIIPNYNHASYLDERISSILEQRAPPTEIIVLDDCSTDESLAVLDRWKGASPVPFTVVCSNHTSGSTFKQWTRGLGLATGDLIWFAESDDASSPDFLERLVPYFAEDRLSLAYSESRVIGADGEWLADSYRFYTDSISPTKWLSAYVEVGCCEIDQALGIKNTIPNASAVLFRRSVLSRYIQSTTAFRYCGDWWAYICCLADGCIGYHPEALNIHRRRAGSVTSAGEAGPGMLEEALRIKAVLWRSPALSDYSRAMGLIQIFVEARIRTGGYSGNDPFVDTLLDEWFAATKDRACGNLAAECRLFADRLISEAAALGTNDRQDLLRCCDSLLARLWP
jgi:glycosyltransferase involved in cell wall biosynthesis